MLSSTSTGTYSNGLNTPSVPNSLVSIHRQGKDTRILDIPSPSSSFNRRAEPLVLVRKLDPRTAREETSNGQGTERETPSFPMSDSAEPLSLSQLYLCLCRPPKRRKRPLLPPSPRPRLFPREDRRGRKISLFLPSPAPLPNCCAYLP